MKKIFVLILILQTQSVLAHKPAMKKILDEGKQSYSTYYCKQKVLPIEVKYIVLEKEISVEISFEANLSKFQVSNARGIDGVIVTEKDSHEAQDFEKEDKDALSFGYTKSSGLGYAVFEAQGEISGVMRTQMIVIPIGKLSSKQKKERQKNIIHMNQKAPGNNSKTDSGAKQKFYRMKI